MLLAIDVGNTQTVLGIYDNDKLVHMWRVATNVDHTSDELRIKLHTLMMAEGLEYSHIDGAILASVVPALTHNWEKACCRSFNVDTLVVSAASAGHLINVDMSRFPELGADRVADAAAAKHLYGSPVIVVDFGTATNIEIINKEGTFVGGIIAPGVESSMKSLFSRAALLRSVELEDPGTAIGTNTAECKHHLHLHQPAAGKGGHHVRRGGSYRWLGRSRIQTAWIRGNRGGNRWISASNCTTFKFYYRNQSRIDLTRITNDL